MTPEVIEWVLLAQQGDQAAFARLVARFEGPVFGIVLRRLRNRTQAADVTQDVFIQMFRKLDQLREPERFCGWLKQIAVRMAINFALRKPHEALPGGETLAGVASSPSDPLGRLLQHEQADQVHEGLGRLRDLDRRTLIAFYIEGQSLKEMSDEFASPIGTIKRRLHTARNRLKDELAGLQMVG